MTEEEKKDEQPQSESYDLTLIKKNPDHQYKLATRGNTVVPLTMKAIKSITPTQKGSREPNQTECLQLLDTSLGQQANPYAKECGLMPSKKGGFHYEVWVAAQVRMRKALSNPDYDGYEWGWITSDGTRHQAGQQGKSSPSEIIGVWGKVYRKNKKIPFYHETFLEEYKKQSKSGRGSWDQKPITMLLKVNRDQTHKFAYADQMGNLCTENELQTTFLPESAEKTLTPRRKDAEGVKVSDTPKPPDEPDEKQQRLFETALKGCANILAQKVMDYWGVDVSEAEKISYLSGLCMKLFGGEAGDYQNEDETLKLDWVDADKLRTLKQAAEEWEPEPTDGKDADNGATEENEGAEQQEEQPTTSG